MLRVVDEVMGMELSLKPGGSHERLLTVSSTSNNELLGRRNTGEGKKQKARGDLHFVRTRKKATKMKLVEPKSQWAFT